MFGLTVTEEYTLWWWGRYRCKWERYCGLNRELPDYVYSRSGTWTGDGPRLQNFTSTQWLTSFNKPRPPKGSWAFPTTPLNCITSVFTLTREIFTFNPQHPGTEKCKCSIRKAKWRMKEVFNTKTENQVETWEIKSNNYVESLLNWTNQVKNRL